MSAVTVPLFLLLPRAARGYRGVMGPESRRPALIALTGGLLVLVMAAIAFGLKERTHHRGLGGATFGILAIGGVVGCSLLAERAWRAAQNWLARGGNRNGLMIATGMAVGGPLLVLASVALRSGPGVDAYTARALVFDLLLAAVVVTAIQVRGLPRLPRGRFQLVFPTITALAIVIGGWQAMTTPASATIQKTGGLPSAVLHVLQNWTDHDGDGYGAYFGGGDCDEGDPRRHPGAPDPTGDGTDTDCDGVDGQAGAAAALSPVASNRPGPVPSTASTQDPEASSGQRTRSAPQHTSSPAKPDIILVTLDTVRADRTSLYGYEKPTTPTLVELAKRGVVFDHAFAVASDTQRALMPLVSTQPLSKTARTKLKWPAIKNRTETLAERLKVVGYQTAAVSSFTWIRKDLGFQQGFDHFSERPFRDFHPERMTTGRVAVKIATKLYDRMAKQKAPLFLWLHLFDAHEKYLAHEGIDFGSSRSGRYDGEIAFVDRQLKTLIDHVDSGARAARTTWIVHGSHGEGFDEHGVRGHGTELYNEMLHVPLLIAGSSTTRGHYKAAAVSMLDIAPTILDLATASLKDSAGRSLKAIAQGALTATHPPILAHAWRRRCVIDWPFKLMVIRRGEKRDRLLLFDMDRDPKERHDLSDSHKEDLKRMSALSEQLG
jgi:arylsulfatase A-like enzyme